MTSLASVAKLAPFRAPLTTNVAQRCSLGRLTVIARKGEHKACHTVARKLPLGCVDEKAVKKKKNNTVNKDF